MATQGVNPKDIQKAQEKVANEPPAGIQGAGTAEQPYDQGNQAEQSVVSEEPISGVKGPGTAEKPYDQGNQPGE